MKDFGGYCRRIEISEFESRGGKVLNQSENFICLDPIKRSFLPWHYRNNPAHLGRIIGKK